MTSAAADKNWLDKAMDEYYRFFTQKYVVKPVNNSWYSITTPFLNMFNDYIEIYCCRQDDGKIYLTDDGETLRDLDLAGVSILHSPSLARKALFDKVLLNYGVQFKKSDGTLYVATDLEHFAQAKLNFLKAIMEVSDMYVLSKPTVRSVFRDDVRSYLDKNNVIYTPQFIAKGRSGLDFTFAFQMAGKQKEILVNTFSSMNKIKLTSFLFDWEDIRQVREELTGKKIAGIAIINDTDRDVDERYLEALHNKGADYILYSQKDKKESIKKLDVTAA